VVKVAQAGRLGAAGHAGAACGQAALAGDLHGKHHAARREVVFVFGDAVGFDFFFVA
jgi:hypothetical protein